ncbi:MAG: hypothetical protein MRJ96_14750 [Nitrospirales bacterium]|nr:hypothetical protein [Nitrospira sp.]MDR4502701.1 hypothetical protein [Nitrospirales bacterium]
MMSLACLFVVSCTAIDHSQSPILDQQASWALLPILNYTETPQAGRRAESITSALLHSRGLQQVQQYPSNLQDGASVLGSDHQLYDSALAWAKKQNIRYGITGTVDEWRYKVGIDGEPAVGVSLRLIDLKTDQVVWSAVGGQTGWSREAVSAVAQKLIKRLLDEVTLS